MYRCNVRSLLTVNMEKVFMLLIKVPEILLDTRILGIYLLIMTLEKKIDSTSCIVLRFIITEAIVKCSRMYSVVEFVVYFVVECIL